MQVPCTALMITILVLTLACVLARSTNKSLLWTQIAVSSLTSVLLNLQPSLRSRKNRYNIGKRTKYIYIYIYMLIQKKEPE